MIRSLLLLATLVASAAGAAVPYAKRADVQAFVDEVSERHGIARNELLRQFARVKPSPAVIKAIRPPTDPRVRSWSAYRARFVEPTRIARGIAFYRQHGDALSRAEAEFGVPAEIIVAIIGIETIYGQQSGHFHVFNALSNLAFDYPPRAELFRHELEELLLLARDQGKDPWHYRGSYAGAMGMPQFLPSSIRRYAIDFDGNGRIELDRSIDDSIGSVASFLSQHGWQPGEPIMAPTDDGAQTLPADGSSLIELATPDGPTEYRLGYNNFFVLTRYNRSSFYAAAVADLALAVKQGMTDQSRASLSTP